MPRGKVRVKPSVLEEISSSSQFYKLINPFASIGRTGTSKVSVLKSAIGRTGTSAEISVFKVSL